MNLFDPKKVLDFVCKRLDERIKDLEKIDSKNKSSLVMIHNNIENIKDLLEITSITDTYKKSNEARSLVNEVQAFYNESIFNSLVAHSNDKQENFNQQLKERLIKNLDKRRKQNLKNNEIGNDHSGEIRMNDRPIRNKSSISNIKKDKDISKTPPLKKKSISPNRYDIWSSPTHYICKEDLIKAAEEEQEYYSNLKPPTYIGRDLFPVNKPKNNILPREKQKMTIVDVNTISGNKVEKNPISNKPMNKKFRTENDDLDVIEANLKGKSKSPILVNRAQVNSISNMTSVETYYKDKIPNAVYQSSSKKNGVPSTNSGNTKISTGYRDREKKSLTFSAAKVHEIIEPIENSKAAKSPRVISKSPIRNKSPGMGKMIKGSKPSPIAKSRDISPPKDSLTHKKQSLFLKVSTPGQKNDSLDEAAKGDSIHMSSSSQKNSKPGSTIPNQTKINNKNNQILDFFSPEKTSTNSTKAIDFNKQKLNKSIRENLKDSINQEDPMHSAKDIRLANVKNNRIESYIQPNAVDNKDIKNHKFIYDRMRNNVLEQNQNVTIQKFADDHDSFDDVNGDEDDNDSYLENGIHSKSISLISYQQTQQDQEEEFNSPKFRPHLNSNFDNKETMLTGAKYILL